MIIGTLRLPAVTLALRSLYATATRYHSLKRTLAHLGLRSRRSRDLEYIWVANGVCY